MQALITNYLSVSIYWSLLLHLNLWQNFHMILWELVEYTPRILVRATMVYPKVSGLSHNEIYAYNNRHSLRSNTKGYGDKTD
jgi:hypothetical protein